MLIYIQIKLVSDQVLHYKSSSLVGYLDHIDSDKWSSAAAPQKVVLVNTKGKVTVHEQKLQCRENL